MKKKINLPSLLLEFKHPANDPTLSTDTLHMDEGTVPVSSAFPPKLMLVSPFKLPRLDGTAPRIALLERSRLRSELTRPSAEGIVPDRPWFDKAIVIT